MKKSLNSILILLFIAGTFLFLFGCGENKTIIPAEKDLPAGLSPQVKAALLAGVYTWEDYNVAQSLIAAGKTEEMKIPPVKFALPGEKRFTASEYTGGVKILDNKKIANMNFFEIKGDLEKAKGDLMDSYSGNRTREFNKNVIFTAKGNFCPKSPNQEVTIYKLKCYINSHVRYLIVMSSQINGKEYFGALYNTDSPNPKMGDVLATLLSTMEVPPS